MDRIEMGQDRGMNAGRRWFVGLLLACIGSCWCGCGGSQSGGTGSAESKTGQPASGQAGTQAAATKLRVVATVGMVADLAREIGGSYVEVTQLMGAGVDPHLYKATRDDVQLILNADLVLYSGLKLEGKLADTLRLAAARQPVVAVAEGLDASQLIGNGDGSDHADPHVWMDVSAWMACLPRVRDALTSALPDQAAEFNQAMQAYQAKLQALHDYGVATMQTIPEAKRVLITSHDAFQYFGRAYGLTVEGVQGISTESEAGLQRINELVDLLVDRQVEAIFVESSVPRKNIEALADGARARGHNVKIGSELFSDAMGTTGTYEGTYIGMLDHNITRVAQALGGKAPARGLNGQLPEEPSQVGE